MGATILHRVDPSQNMARFYELDLQPGLFGDISLTRHWGRIGAHGQSKEHWFASETAADELAGKLMRQKQHRGYIAKTVPIIDDENA